MSMFKVIGLRHPGKVNLFRFGTVDLCLLSDDKLLEIYRADPSIPYLQPTAEGLNAIHGKAIEVKSLPSQPPEPVEGNVDPPGKKKKSRTKKS